MRGERSVKRDGLREQLGGALGSDQGIFDTPEILEDYSKDLSFVPARKPRAIVKPRNKDEVQAIVKWANQTRTPLVPVSSGPPHLRGDTISTVGGAVIMDLSGMNRIMKVDRLTKMFQAQRYAPKLIEVGKEISEAMGHRDGVSQ